MKADNLHMSMFRLVNYEPLISYYLYNKVKQHFNFQFLE